MTRPPLHHFNRLAAAAALWVWCGPGFAANEQTVRLTLDSALDRAIATDQTIAIADYEVRKARVEQFRALTRVMPSLSVGADATWRGDRTKEIIEIEEPVPTPTVPSVTATPGAGNGTTGGTVTPRVTTPVRISRVARWTRSSSDQQSAGINFSQPILDFTVGPARRQGEIGRQITEWQLRQQLREVLFGVAQQFIEVIKQERLVEEGRKTLGLTSEQVRQAEARFEAEEVIASDVLQARVDDERARRAVIESENSLALARTRLAITLNLGLSVPLLLVEPTKGRLAAPDIARAVEFARMRREEVHIAHLSLSRTWAERDEIKARFAPTLDFQWSRDLATGSSFERRTGWTAGFALNWPLIDRGQRALDLRTNRLQIQQDGLRIDDTVRVVSDDVANAWYAVELLQKRIPSLVVERTAAESNYRVQEEKYRTGLATSLEVQTAIRDLARSRADLVASTYDLEVAYRDLETVLADYESERIDQAMRQLLAPVGATMPVKMKNHISTP